MTWLNSAAVQKFHDDLAEIPTLYADLPAILTGIKGQSGGVHTPPGSKPPLAGTASTRRSIGRNPHTYQHHPKRCCSRTERFSESFSEPFSESLTTRERGRHEHHVGIIVRLP